MILLPRIKKTYLLSTNTITKDCNAVTFLTGSGLKHLNASPKAPTPAPNTVINKYLNCTYLLHGVGEGSILRQRSTQLLAAQPGWSSNRLRLLRLRRVHRRDHSRLLYKIKFIIFIIIKPSSLNTLPRILKFTYRLRCDGRSPLRPQRQQLLVRVGHIDGLLNN